MNDWLSIWAAGITELTTRFAWFLLDVGAKGAVVLLAAWGASLTLRKAPAAARHALWTAASAALVLLPVLSLTLPQWKVLPSTDRIPQLVWKGANATLPPPHTLQGAAEKGASGAPATATPAPFAANSEPRRDAAPNHLTDPTLDGRSAGMFRVEPDAAPVIQGQATAAPLPRTVPWWGKLPVVAWVVLAYSIGLLLCLIIPLLGMVALRGLSRRARVMKRGAWGRMLKDATGLMGISRHVTLLRGGEGSMPMTWGTWRPRVLLPREASQWPSDRRRMVLLHELAHVRRMDCLTQWIARLACTVHWFNPLAWMAAGRMRMERERACDDAVLAAGGGKNSDYAEHLLEVAARLQAPGLMSAMAVAMARPSALEGRLVAILDEKRNRRTLGRLALLALALILSAIVLPVAMLRQNTVARAEPLAAPVKAAPVAAPPALAAVLAEKPAEDKAFELTVIDAKTRQPVGDVPVSFNWDGKSRKDRTDARGRCWLMVGPSPKWFSVSVKVDGYAPASASWRQDQGDKEVPESFTFELEEGTTIGGVVQDEDGKPIAGATVYVAIWNREDRAGFNRAEKPAARQRASLYDHPCKTDKDGKWFCNLMPAKLEADQLGLRLAHPDFINDPYYNTSRAGTIDELRKGTATIVMKRGVVLEGRVLDKDGQPIAGAKVAQGADRFGSNIPKTTTDDEGKFLFPAVQPGQVVVTVQAEGHAPDLKQIQVHKDLGPVEFKLGEAKTLRGKVLDSDGKPVKGSMAVVDTWRGHRSLDWRVNTDAEGRFEWKSAPADEMLMDFGTTGYAYQRHVPLIAGDKEHVITLRRPFVIKGTVVDAETGKPIDNFIAVPGGKWENQDRPWFNMREPRRGENGKFELSFDDSRLDRLCRVEADGYEPLVSPIYKKDAPEDSVTWEAKLKKGVGPVGVVLLPDGKPAEGAEVVLCTPNGGAYVRNGRNERNSDAHVSRTGPDGKFKFPPQTEAWKVLALHDSGIAEADKEAFAKSPEMRLTPWGEIQGTVTLQGKPAAGAELGLSWQDEYGPDKPRAYFHYETHADASGKFSFKKVKPGPVKVARLVKTPHGGGGFSVGHTQMTDVTVEAGKTAVVELGNKGRPVIGKLGIPPETPKGYSFQHSYVMTKAPEFKEPEGWTKMTREQRQEISNKFMQSDEYKNYQKNQRSYSVEMSPDGSFRIEGVESGTYQFNVNLMDVPRGRNVWESEWLGSATREFTMPAIPGGKSDEPLDLGTVEVKLRKRLLPGMDAPPFEIKSLDETKTLKLADFKGKHLLLELGHPWARRNKPEVTKAMQEAWAKYGKDERFAMLSVNMDTTVEDAKKDIEELKMPWPMSAPVESPRAEWLKAYDVTQTPLFYLIGPDGKVLARTLSGAELKAELEEALP